MLYVFCFSPNCLRKWMELVPSMSLPSLSLPSLSSSKIEALWQQNKIWQRTNPGSAACGCLMPQVSLSLSLPTLFSIFYFFHFKVCSLPQLWSFARMCVTVKRSGTSSLRNCVRFLLAWFFPCSSFSTFPHFHNFRISFVRFSCGPINIYWAAARAVSAQSSKGLVTVLTWLLVRRISLSNQHHLSALNSKSGHNSTRSESKRKSRKWPWNKRKATIFRFWGQKKTENRKQKQT